MRVRKAVYCRPLATWAIAVLAGQLALPASSQPSGRGSPFRIVDLGTLGGERSAALAVDAVGSVVGWSTTVSGERRAFLAREGTALVDLGTLPNGSYSLGTAISDDGTWVAGSSAIRPLVDPQQFPDIEQGFVWNDGALQSVGALYNPATFNRRFGTSAAHAVNDAGQVVGFSIVQRQNLQSAFLWQDGVMTDLGRANDTAANSRAFDINDAGLVVGDIRVAGTTEAQACAWREGVLELLPHADGYAQSSALAVNAAGQVAGWSGNGAQTVAVLWSGASAQALGVLSGDESSQALAVDELGQVVGWSGNAEQRRAFLWQGGVMIDLNTLLPAGSGWTLTEAAALNEQGVIVGSGVKDGQTRAFALRPRAIGCG